MCGETRKSLEHYLAHYGTEEMINCLLDVLDLEILLSAKAGLLQRAKELTELYNGIDGAKEKYKNSQAARYRA